MRPIHGKRRDTNRAEGFDYAMPGWYYVTVCTHELRPMFGEVVDGEMIANRLGEIVTEEWHRTSGVRSDVILDAFVLMPNHFHAIIVIEESEPLVRATRCVALGPEGAASFPERMPDDQAAASGTDARATQRVARTRLRPSTLGSIVGQIKSSSSRRINSLRGTPGAPVWHRNYYDHIIRDERDLDRVRAYIANNPSNWPFDRANGKETPIP